MPLRPRRVVPALLALVLLAAAARAAEPPRALPGEVLVRFRPGLRDADRASLRGAMHAQRLARFPFIDVEHWKLEGLTTEQAIARFAADPRVQYVEPNYEIHLDLTPSDSLFPQMYGLRNTGQTGGTPGADIHAVNAWDVFTGDSTLKVGCIDTGIDYLHPDLAANVWTNPGEIPDNGIDDDGNGYVDDVHGYDFVNNDGDPMDDNGHGTHTAGTIAAIGDNRIGVTGVAWRARLVAIKFLNSRGSGSYAAAIAAIQYAIAVGCRLTSNSWGGGGFSQALLDAINAAGAAGQLFVAAAGNSGQDMDAAPAYPAAFDSPWKISVAATDADDRLAPFSNFGLTTVDLAAPGVNILSTLPNGNYGLASGTSMATPHVSGAVALAMGRFPDLGPLAIRALVLDGADRLPQLAGTSVTGGRLNAFALVATPDSIAPGPIPDLAVSDPGSNTVLLTWTDTGDDGAVGRAARYEIRYALSPITPESFAAATLVPGTPDPRPAGTPESFPVSGLQFLTRYWFALRALDEQGNPGPISNVVSATTLGVPRAALAPDSIAATLLSEASLERTVTLSNVGEGTLDFTLPTPALVFQQGAALAPLDVVKGDDGAPGPIAVSGFGGPDGGGYRWVDSDAAEGPRFDWVELADTTTPLPMTGDDFVSAPISLAFPFPFYGRLFDSVRLCTNGFLSFTDLVPAFGNLPLPGSGAPENLIAPFWDDLSFGGTPRAYARCDPARCVFEYVNAGRFAGGGSFTFEVILYPSGEIRYQYLSMAGLLTSATVGLQDGSRRDGLTVAYNSPYVHDSLAVRLGPLPQWLTVTPTSGRLRAGESLPLAVHLDGHGLSGGRYLGSLDVDSNDPAGPRRQIPVTVRLQGAPDLVVSPGSLAFDSVFVGARPTRPLRISNPGTDVLEVTAITASDPSLSVDVAAFELARFDARTLAVRWAPVTAGPLDATLTLASNDPDAPATVVHVTGVATPAPSFAVAPESLGFAVLTGGTASGALHIANRGGSDFVFRAHTLTGAAGAVAAAGVAVQSDADNRTVGKGALDVLAGPAPLGLGGPDGFGYTYRDSHEPAGPAFAWEDVRPTGVPVDLVGDDAVSAPIAIGFDFPFYGVTFDSCRVSTNGFVSFSATTAGFSNTTLPNQGAGVPENLLAVFWDDLVFPAGRHAFVRSDGAHLVIQFQDVPRFGEGAYPNTFEIVLRAGGQIEYRYLAVSTPNPRSATVGIQDGTRTDGLQVAFNAPYLESGLAVRFDPPARWLTVSPREGRLAPGGEMDLTASANAAGVYGGDYAGLVRIEGNDPLDPRHDVPVRLHVTGVPVAAADPVALDFGRVSIGEPRTLPLTVRNLGSDSLRVDKLSTDDARYTPATDHLIVPPFGARVVGVTFAPAGSGPVPSRLTVRSNDPGHGLLEVALAASGVPPPRLELSPDSLRGALATTLGPEALEEVKRLVIANRGGNDLDWSARALLGVGIAATSPALEAEGAKGDPGLPGALGAAGPDAGGYRWIDSDEPGAPPFDWLDLRAIGTRLPLDGDDQTTAAIALPFRFDFYGTSFDSLHVCTNGWASFTSTLTTYTNTPLPNAGRAVPENLLAVFWDDQDFGPAAGSASAYTWSDSTRFVVAFHDVPHQGYGGPYTYELVLDRDGTLDYQYLSMGTRLTEATIGIQNADRTVGLQVASNAHYVHDRLRAHLTRVPPWLELSAGSGRVAPGGADTLEVRLRAAAMPDGDLHGAVRIESGDRLAPLIEVPVTLHVGTAAAECRITPRTLNLAHGGPYAHLRVAVPGQDPRQIDVASLRVNGTVGAASGQPVSYGGDAATFRLSVLDLTAVLPAGALVPLRTTGRVGDVTWFVADDTLRILRPNVRAPAVLHAYGSGLPISSFTAGERVVLAWEDAGGERVERWEVWCSSDAGATWQRAGETRSRTFEWTVPGPPTESALIEIVGCDRDEMTEDFISDPFRVLPGAGRETLPLALGLGYAGLHPARGAVRLRLALPERADVELRVYDLFGAVVRRLALGSLEPGFHPVAWDGADAAGRPVRPGVYFARATAAGRSVTLRIALIR